MKQPPTLQERVRVAVWLLERLPQEDVSQDQAVVNAAVIVLTGEP